MTPATHPLRKRTTRPDLTPSDDAESRNGSLFVVSCDKKGTPQKLGEIRLQFADQSLQMRLERASPLFSTLACSVADMPHPINRNLIESMARLMILSQEPLYAAFLARSFNALARLTPKLGPDALGEAIGEPSDYEVLLRALAEPTALEAFGEGPLMEARLRDLELRTTIQEAEGGVLTVEEVAQLLGVTRQAIDKRRRAGRLLALPVGQHRNVYPAWQFKQGGVLEGFEEVLAELSMPDPWTQAAFFLGENSSLNGQRPLDELRRGNIEAARRAAWAMGEQGAA
jgi:hypothetical protein